MHDLKNYSKNEKIRFLEECGWKEDDECRLLYWHTFFPFKEDFSSEQEVDEVIENFYWDLWKFTRKVQEEERKVQGGSPYQDSRKDFQGYCR